MKKYKFSDIVKYQKKSKIKASAGKDKGLYPFFTSSNTLSKYIDEYTNDGEYLIFGTGGSASVNYYNGKFATSTDNFIVEVTKDVNAKYIYYYLKNNINIIERGFHGAGLKHLSKRYLDDIDIPVPEKKIQNLIVSIQDSISNQLSQYELNIKYLKDLRISKFNSFLNNCEKVEEMSLKQCADFIDYRGGTPKVQPVGDIRMINAKSVGDGYFKYINEFVTEELYNDWMHRGFAYPGDILFVTEGATFGYSCMIPDNIGKFALGQRVITIQGKKDVLCNEFLFCYMLSLMFKESINYYMTGGTAKGIRSKDLEKILIPIPEYNKQKEFSKFLHTIQSLLNNIEQNMVELNKLNKSIFNKVLEEDSK